MRVSKEVQATRDYEAALLRGYQAYLKTLLAAADAGPRTAAGKARPAAGAAAAHGGTQHSALLGARVAVRCMAGLLEALPHFNYARCGTTLSRGSTS